MGQAKNRGTYEQRVAQAKARQEAEQKALAERLAAERKAEREAAIAARMDGSAVVVKGRERITRTALLAALALAGVSNK